MASGNAAGQNPRFVKEQVYHADRAGADFEHRQKHAQPLYDAMNRSSLRDTAWVRHRFGFDGEPCTLTAAARDYGLSISRARRIEDEALRHIRENLAAQGREKEAA